MYDFDGSPPVGFSLFLILWFEPGMCDANTNIIHSMDLAQVVMTSLQLTLSVVPMLPLFCRNDEHQSDTFLSQRINK
jgi:riboflavin transporter FmnP